MCAIRRARPRGGRRRTTEAHLEVEADGGKHQAPDRAQVQRSDRAEAENVAAVRDGAVAR